MAASIIIYLLKVSLAQIIFYLLYILLLKNQTHFQLNRFYLLFTLMISFFLPFLTLPKFSSQAVTGPLPGIVQPLSEGSQLIHSYASLPLNYKPVVLEITMGDILLVLYGLGTLIFLIRFVARLLRLRKVIKESQVGLWQNHKTLIHPSMPISSFFSFIFWKKEATQHDHLIWQHEKIHSNQWHSLDIILVEICTIIHWFNPFLRKVGSELSLVHEFIADKEVIDKHQNKSIYAELLLNHSDLPVPYLGTSFHSFIKKRLTMLHRKKSSIFSYLHYFLTFPIFICVLILFTSAKNHEFWSNTESQLSTITAYTLHSSISQDHNAPYMVIWGDISIPIAPSPNRPTDNLYGRISLSKEELTKSINLPLRVLKKDGSASEPVELDHFSISYNKLGKNRGRQRFYTAVNGKSVLLPDSVLYSLAKAEDLMTLSLMASHNKTILNFTVQVRHPATRANFLAYGKNQFIIEPYVRQGIPRFQYINNSNKVDYEVLLEMMTNKNFTIVYDGDKKQIGDITFYLLKDMQNSLSPTQLIGKLKSSKKIEDPIAMLGSDHLGTTYISLFDDDEIPVLNYLTWRDFYRSPKNYHIRYAFVNEEQFFKWGPLKLNSPRQDELSNLAWNFNYFSTPKLEETEGLVDRVFIKKMLKAKPVFVLDDNKVDQYTISFRYIDHIGVPFDCTLQISNRKIVNGSEVRDEALQRLKPGDFIEKLTVSIDGERSLICRSLKIS